MKLGLTVMKPAPLLIAALCVPGTSNASLTLQVSDGINSFVCADGASCDLSTTAGVVLFSQSVGNWLVDINTGVSKPAQGSAISPYLQLTNSNLTFSGSTGTPLTIMLSETDFTTPAGVNAFNYSAGGLIDGSSVTFSSYLDNTNALFGTGSLLGTLGAFLDTNPASSTNTAFSGSSVVSASNTVPFSLTLVAQFAAPPAGLHNSSVTTQLDLAPVPVPAAAYLLGSGLIGLFGFSRRGK